MARGNHYTQKIEEKRVKSINESVVNYLKDNIVEGQIIVRYPEDETRMKKFIIKQRTVETIVKDVAPSGKKVCKYIMFSLCLLCLCLSISCTTGTTKFWLFVGIEPL